MAKACPGLSFSSLRPLRFLPVIPFLVVGHGRQPRGLVPFAQPARWTVQPVPDSVHNRRTMPVLRHSQVHLVRVLLLVGPPGCHHVIRRHVTAESGGICCKRLIATSTVVSICLVEEYHSGVEMLSQFLARLGDLVDCCPLVDAHAAYQLKVIDDNESRRSHLA